MNVNKIRQKLNKTNLCSSGKNPKAPKAGAFVNVHDDFLPPEKFHPDEVSFTLG